jgi:oligopeptidase B
MVYEAHGDRREDPYHWLRDKDDPAVRAYLEAENARAEQALAATKQHQEALYQEILARIRQTDLSVPYRQGAHVYYSRTEEGKQYKIYCRKQAAGDAPEEILLDLNRMAESHRFLALGAFQVSDDGNFLAYSLDVSGFRVYDLHVKDLRTGEALPDSAGDVGSVAWAADNRTLFYTIKDDAKRPYRLYRHMLSSAAETSEEDALILEEGDAMFGIGVWRSRSGRYLFLEIGSHTTSEVHYLAAGTPEGTWTVVSPRQQDREYYVDHHGDRFYILANDTGRNFRLVSATADDPRAENWEEILPHDPEAMLEGLDLFAGHSVLYQRIDGLPGIRITDLHTGESHLMEFPEPAYSASPGINRHWETSTLRFTYQSLVTPESVFDYDMDSRERTLRKQDEVLGGYDPERYVSRRLHATAEDGTRIPISLVHRNDVAQDGSAPLLLVGYGSYGYPYPVTFSSHRLSLLDRGVVMAIAHIRGGGELGKKWHDQGRMMYKRNTFTDFIAAAEFLVEEGITSTDRLVIQGGSAGGLLVGAVANLRPGLFRAVLSQVPFVDVLNTMLDSSLPLTVAEYEEWGNPNEKGAYDYIKSYCPYTNLEAKDYPAMLVRTSFNDSQVMYWEPAKYVARLRSLKTDDHPLLLLTNMNGGHGGSSGRYDRLREIAVDYAFLLEQMGTPLSARDHKE